MPVKLGAKSPLVRHSLEFHPASPDFKNLPAPTDLAALASPSGSKVIAVWKDLIALARRRWRPVACAMLPSRSGTFCLSAASIAVMIRSYPLKRTVIRLLIGVIVYAQLALAAYACNTGISPLAGSTTGHAAGQVNAAVHPQQLDVDQPSLCVSHCRFDQQNADPKPLPLPAVALVAGYFTLEPLTPDGERYAPVLTAGALPPLADPPHAVLHCCLRI